MRINPIYSGLAALILSGFSTVSLAADFSLASLTEDYSLGYEFGTSFGGKEVAENNNGGLGGDNYNAGGGAILSVTADVAVSEKINARALGGFRYQGGDGSNSGLVLEGSAIYKFTDTMFVGAGLHTDLFNEVETANGENVEFDAAIGPMVMAEWFINPKLGLGAKYILMDYETSEGTTYDGNQGAIYVRMNSL